MTLEVDARNVTQGIQHAHLTIPVHPGPLTLGYPSGSRASTLATARSRR